MSLDISIYDAEDNQVAEINWLRNSFGLPYWVEGNLAVAEIKADGDLWEVCNKWAYDKAKDIDRAEFKRVVDSHDAAVQTLERGYYLFGISEFINTILPHWNRIATEERFGTRLCPGQKYTKDGRIALPMPEIERLAGALHLGDHATLDYYKAWMKRLANIADLLQNPTTRFYCSN